jgi:type I restriction enzyme S subunit
VRRASQISKQEMNAYPEYKESGIDWLGKIPSHWSVIKTNYAFDNIGSGTTPDTNNDDYYCESGINWLQTGDLNDGYINHTSKHLTDLAVIEKGLKRYPVNSLVIAMYGATIAKLGLLKIETTVNQACCVLTPSDSIENKYAFFLFQASKKALIMLASGGGQPNISQATIREFRIPVPPLYEQKAIAAYLDEKTGKIDELIVEKTKQVEDLRSFRTSVITEAVTHGLNPNVPLRQSGIDWLGEIPEHWILSRAKYYIDIKSGDAISKDKINDSDDYPVYGGGELIGYTDAFNVEKHTIIIGRVGARCGCITLANTKSWATDNALILNTSINVPYLTHLLEAANLNRLNESNAQPLITATKIKDLFIPVPPISEQQEIADYLDEKTAKIDKLISELNTQLAELAEYKQAVISEAVTGKVDVRDYKSSL